MCRVGRAFSFEITILDLPNQKPKFCFCALLWGREGTIYEYLHGSMMFCVRVPFLPWFKGNEKEHHPCLGYISPKAKQFKVKHLPMKRKKLLPKVLRLFTSGTFTCLPVPTDPRISKKYTVKSNKSSLGSFAHLRFKKT